MYARDELFALGDLVKNAHLHVIDHQRQALRIAEFIEGLRDLDAESTLHVRLLPSRNKPICCDAAGRQEIRRISEWLPGASVTPTQLLLLKSKNQGRRTRVSNPSTALRASANSGQVHRGLGSRIYGVAFFYKCLHPA